MTDPEPPEGEGEDPRETLDRVVRTLVDQLSLACAEIRVGGDAPAATDSYLGGSPYLPVGSDWPTDDHGPQLFVGQVNWAEVPGLDELGFPRAGLLQWFVSADETYGLSFDDSQGATGFTVRWIDDLRAPSRLQPGSPPLTDPEADHPLDTSVPTRMTFRAGRAAPLWADLWPMVTELEIWPTWALLHDRDPRQVGDLFDDFTRLPGNLPAGAVLGSKVGGYPTMTQGDPRGSVAYAVANRGAGFLLIELNSDETGGWGDGGIAQLFGDPEMLATGDLSQVRYHWDCF